MNERQHERLDVDSTEISSDIMFANEVNILNISPGGISLKADKRLDIGKGYTIKIKVKDRSFSVKGKVVWSLLSQAKDDSNGNFIPIYTAGIQFVNGSTEKLEEIIRFIEEHRKDNADYGIYHHGFDFKDLPGQDNQTVLANLI